MARMNHENVNRRSMLQGFPQVQPEFPKRKKVKSKRGRFKSKYDGTCFCCDKQYQKGQEIIYDFSRKRGRHPKCMEHKLAAKSKDELEVEKNKTVRMVSKYDAVCCICKEKVSKGSKINYRPYLKRVSHAQCDHE